MRVKLFQYYGRTDVANKIDDLTPIYDSADYQFTLYGGFSPLAAEFQLSELIDANYAAYYYNSHWYYGSLIIATVANGLYTYKVDTDALTTAWYNGCMNVSNLVTYSSSVNKRMLDTRIQRAEYSTIRHTAKEINDDNGALAVVMVTVGARARADTVVYPDDRSSYAPGTYNVWVFKGDGQPRGLDGLEIFKRFVRSLQGLSGDITRNMESYTASIIKCYIVPAAMVNTLDVAGEYVRLDTLGGTLIDVLRTVTVVPDGSDNEYTAYNMPNKAPLFPQDKEYRFDLSAADYEGPCWSATWEIRIPYVGKVSFVPSATFPQTIQGVGVRVSLNAVGAFYVVQLFGYMQPDVYIYPKRGVTTFPISEEVVLPVPASSTVNIGNIISGSAATVAGVISQNYLGAVASAAGTAASEFNNLKPTGSASGYGGSSEDRLANPLYGLATSSVLLIRDYIPYETDQDEFADIYGYPCNEVLYIGALRGYVQTSGAKLISNGIPEVIVSAAESQCNSGFRIQ